MQNAIEFLRSQNIQVSNTGKILSELPEGEDGLTLINDMEDFTSTWSDRNYGHCFTIIKDQVTLKEI